MRKTLNINLGGMAFIIDENAFELLHNYLEALKRKFNNEAERTEIMNDIESRIGELLSQRLDKSKEVIGIEDVQFVTDAMGKPDDIAGGETEEAGNTTTGQTTTTGAASSAPGASIKKRLFRDPDDAKIGGVISGLCHFFGIQDPVWMRIAALILIFFTSGVIIFVYILLLIIVPKAQTAAEKLQMKGEPVNINTIEKEIKDAANRAGESVNSFVKDQNIFERLWDAVLSMARVLLKLFGMVMIITAMSCLIAVAVCFFAFYVLGSTQYNAASHMLVDSGNMIRLFSVGFFLFVATPFMALVYLGLKILLGQRSRVRWFKFALLGGWVIGLLLLMISASKMLTNYKVSGTTTHDTVLMQPKNGTLYVQLTDTSGKKLNKEWEENTNHSFNIFPGQIVINGMDFDDMDRIPLGKPGVQLMASENDSFYVQEVISAHGRNKNEAIANADMVIYSFSQTDSVLNLPLEYYIDKSGKWRIQQLKIRIAVPRGKQVKFADNIDLWPATVKGDANYDDTYFANTTWTVEDGKVKCIEGENHKNAGDEDMKNRDSRMEKVEKKLKSAEEKLKKLDKHHEDNDKQGKDKSDENKDDKDDQDF
jgi:phage shock protein PspC (stress-responsive transcriptional regulator)